VIKLAVKKSFDCIELKRKAQEKIYRETKDMTADEKIVYFQKGANEGRLGDFWRKLQQHQG
jgi:hypothetical protein